MIYANRVRLRAIERSDLSRFVSWMNDPDVRFGLTIYLPLSLAEEENWFEQMLKRPAPEHPLVIEIEQDDVWEMIGNCGLHNIDWRCRVATAGIFIGEKRYWNRGYGTEVMKLLLKHGFETLNLNRIQLDVYEDNPGAIRAYEKAGFLLEGRKRQGIYKNGEYMDILLMGVLREEWIKDNNA
jgi:RimJ/RimL family protein N-acetyltransferase